MKMNNILVNRDRANGRYVAKTLPSGISGVLSDDGISRRILLRAEQPCLDESDKLYITRVTGTRSALSEKTPVL